MSNSNQHPANNFVIDEPTDTSYHNNEGGFVNEPGTMDDPYHTNQQQSNEPYAPQAYAGDGQQDPYAPQTDVDDGQQDPYAPQAYEDDGQQQQPEEYYENEPPKEQASPTRRENNERDHKYSTANMNEDGKCKKYLSSTLFVWCCTAKDE